MFKKASISFKFVVGLMLTLFVSVLLCADLFKVRHTQASVLGLPEPTQMLRVSSSYEMPVLKGMRIDPENPLDMEFIVDTGNRPNISKEESQCLVNYFLSALTTPNEDLWVNLSPYEKDRILPGALGATEMGRDLLAQDYILKQLSSSLTHPDNQIGRNYWDKLNVGVGIAPTHNDNFNKIWIVPDSIELNEQNGLVLINDAKLKIETEKDYLAHNVGAQHAAPGIKGGSRTAPTSRIACESLLDEISKEVNQGKNFAKLRQVYHSIILAIWFKKKFQDSFYKNYIDQNKTNGIEIEDKQIKEKIWSLYCESFKKGVYKLSKNENNSKQKRTYFSGGFSASSAMNQLSLNPTITKTNTNFLGNTKILKTSLAYRFVNSVVSSAELKAFKLSDFVLSFIGRKIGLVDKKLLNIQRFEKDVNGFSMGKVWSEIRRIDKSIVVDNASRNLSDWPSFNIGRETITYLALRNKFAADNNVREELIDYVVKDNKLLGYIVYSLPDKFDTRREHLINVETVAVDPIAQGTGVVEDLFNKVHTYAAYNGYSQISLLADSNDQRLKKFYTKSLPNMFNGRLNLVYNHWANELQREYRYEVNLEKKHSSSALDAQKENDQDESVKILSQIKNLFARFLDGETKLVNDLENAIVDYHNNIPDLMLAKLKGAVESILMDPDVSAESIYDVFVEATPLGFLKMQSRGPMTTDDHCRLVVRSMDKIQDHDYDYFNQRRIGEENLDETELEWIFEQDGLVRSKVDQRLVRALSVVLHDYGKLLGFANHPKTGARVLKSLLDALELDDALKNEILLMVENHAFLFQVMAGEASPSSVAKRLASRAFSSDIQNALLAVLYYADSNAIGKEKSVLLNDTVVAFNSMMRKLGANQNKTITDVALERLLRILYFNQFDKNIKNNEKLAVAIVKDFLPSECKEDWEQIKTLPKESLDAFYSFLSEVEIQYAFNTLTWPDSRINHGYFLKVLFLFSELVRVSGQEVDILAFTYDIAKFKTADKLIKLIDEIGGTVDSITDFFNKKSQTIYESFSANEVYEMSKGISAQYKNNTITIDIEKKSSSSLVGYYEEDGLLPGAEAALWLGADDNRITTVEQIYKKLDLPIGFELEVFDIFDDEAQYLSKRIPFTERRNANSPEFSFEPTWSPETQLFVYNCIKRYMKQFDDVFDSLQVNVGVKKSDYEVMSYKIQEAFLLDAQRLMTAIVLAYVSDDRIKYKTSDKVVRLRRFDSGTRGINGEDYYRFEYGFADNRKLNEIVNAIYFGHYLLRKSILEENLSLEDRIAIERLNKILSSADEVVEDINFAKEKPELDIADAKTFKVLIPYRNKYSDQIDQLRSDVESMVRFTKNYLGIENKNVLVSSSVVDADEVKIILRNIEKNSKVLLGLDPTDIRDYNDFMYRAIDFPPNNKYVENYKEYLEQLETSYVNSKDFEFAALGLALSKNMFLLPYLKGLYNKDISEYRKEVIVNIMQFIIQYVFTVKQEDTEILKNTYEGRLKKRNAFIKRIVRQLMKAGKKIVKIRDMAVSNGITSMQLSKKLKGLPVQITATDLDKELIIVEKNENIKAVFDKRGNPVQLKVDNEIFGQRKVEIPEEYSLLLDEMKQLLGQAGNERISLVRPEVEKFEKENKNFTFIEEDLFSPKESIKEDDIVIVSNFISEFYFSEEKIQEIAKGFSPHLKDGALLLFYNGTSNYAWIKDAQGQEMVETELGLLKQYDFATGSSSAVVESIFLKKVITGFDELSSSVPEIEEIGDIRDYRYFALSVNKLPRKELDPDLINRMLVSLEAPSFAGEYFSNLALYIASTKDMFLLPRLKELYSKSKTDYGRVVITNIMQYIIQHSFTIKNDKQPILKSTFIDRLNTRNDFIKTLTQWLLLNGVNNVKIRDMAVSNGITTMQLAEVVKGLPVDITASDIDTELIVVDNNDGIKGIFDKRGNCFQLKLGDKLYSNDLGSISEDVVHQIREMRAKLNDVTNMKISLINPGVEKYYLRNDNFRFIEEDLYNPREDIKETDIVVISNLLTSFYFSEAEVEKVINRFHKNLKVGAMLFIYNTAGKPSIWIKKAFSKKMTELDIKKVYLHIQEDKKSNLSKLVKEAALSSSAMLGAWSYWRDVLEAGLVGAGTGFSFVDLAKELHQRDPSKKFKWADIDGGVGILGFSQFASDLKNENVLELYGVGNYFLRPSQRELKINKEDWSDSDYILDRPDLYNPTSKADLPNDMELITSFDVLKDSKNPMGDIAYMYNHLASNGRMIAGLRIPLDNKLIKFYQNQVELMRQELGLNFKLSIEKHSSEKVAELYFELTKKTDNKLKFNKNVSMVVADYQVVPEYKIGKIDPYMIKRVEYKLKKNERIFRVKTGGIDLQEIDFEVAGSALSHFEFIDPKIFGGFSAKLISIEDISKQEIIAMAG